MDEITFKAKTDALTEITGDIIIDGNDTDDDEQDYNTNVFIYNALQKSNVIEYQSDVEFDDVWVKRYPCDALLRMNLSSIQT